jgi:glycosyltransferase involved in cell wall biosynthesis
MRMTGVGGSENHLRVLLPELRRHGWEPDVLIPTPRAAAAAPVASELAEACGKVIVVPMRLDASPGLLMGLARLMRSGRYGIVHSHLVHADWHVGCASIAAPEVTLVSTKHNDDPFRRGFVFRGVERAVTNRCAMVIAISEALRHFTLRWTHPRTDVVTVHYGLKAPGHAPPARSEDPVPTLLAVARLVRQKGLDVLVRAMRAVTSRVPDARLLIAGEGPERAALERLVRNLGLEQSVSLLGHREDVPELMRRAWLLVHAARWEGFGLVLLEAMQEGLPVIATAVGAVPEIVVDGETGRLVAPDDDRAFADAVLAALGEQRFRREAGAGGFQRLVERFSADAMGRATAAVYDRATATTSDRLARASPTPRTRA